MKETTSLFSIGSIVTFSSNHLKSKEHFDVIQLNGDPRFITPLMIVTEILLEKVSFSDPKKGEYHNSSFRYKCIWFSTRSFTLEEVWLKEELLIEIEPPGKDIITINIKDKVSFITTQLELKKRKSSLAIEGSESKRKVTPLLDFTSPVFIVVGTSNFEPKDPLIDNKTGKTKRWVVSKMIKCKFFNILEDKYSEVIIPVEALKVIKVNEGLLQKLINVKNENDICILDIDYSEQEKTTELSIWARIKEINALNGIYLISIEDIFTRQVKDVLLNNIDLVKVISFEDLEPVRHYPDIKPSGAYFQIASIESYLDKLYENYWALDEKERKKSKLTNDIFYIQYKNKFEKVTQRYVVPIMVYHSKEDIKGEKEKYLLAFCLLRNDLRYFKTDRIQKLEVISNQELFEYGWNKKEHAELL